MIKLDKVMTMTVMKVKHLQMPAHIVQDILVWWNVIHGLQQDTSGVSVT